MNWPYKYIKIKDGIILLYIKKDMVVDNQISFDILGDGTMTLSTSNYYIPLDYLNIDYDMQQYYIYMGGGDFGAPEATIFHIIHLDLKLLTKLHLFKEMQMLNSPAHSEA